MATTYTRIFTTTCVPSLYDAIQDNTTITKNLEQIIQDTSTGNSDFIFTNALTTGEETELDNILGSWTCPAVDAVDIRSYEYFADQFLNPTTADWAVSEFAPAAVDTINAEIIVRRFDDTTEEGVGFQIKTPKTFNNIRFIIRSRPQSAPTSDQSVVLNLYEQEIPDGGSVPAWASDELGAITYPSGSTNWIYHTIDNVPSDLGLDPDTVYLLELTRDAGDVNDSLSGDMVLLSIEIEMS